MINMTRIRELRKKFGLSQSELAKKFNVDQTAVSKWELGKTYPDMDLALLIAGFFNVSVEYLLGKEEKSSANTELKDVYFNFAKRAQDSGLDPEDIEMILTMAERMKKKKSNDQKGTL